MARLWTPNDLAVKPLVFFDQQDPSTITQSGGKVSAWANKGTVGGSIGQPTASLQPSYSATALNGYPAIVFEQGLFMWGNIPLNAAKHFHAATCTMTGANPNSRILSLAADNTDDAGSTVGGIPMFAPGTNIASFKQGTIGGTTPVTSNSPFLAEFGFDGVNYNRYLNGTQVVGQTSGGYALASTRMAIGAGISNSGTTVTSVYGDSYFRGPIAEIIVLGYTPSADELARLQGYRAHRNGLQGNLPANHPYKDTAPMVSGGPSLVADKGSAMLTGVPANTKAARRLVAALGPTSVTGLSAGLVRSVSGGSSLAAERGSIAAAGRTANLLHGYSLPLSGTTLVFSGQPADVRRNRSMSAAVGGLALVGRAANLLRGFALAAAQGMLTLAGKPAQLRSARALTSAPAAYNISGQSAGFARAGFGSLLALRGVYAVSGQTVATRLSRLLAVSPGIFDVTGRAAQLTTMRRFYLSGGTYALQGFVVSLRRGVSPNTRPAPLANTVTLTLPSRLTTLVIGSRSAG